MAERPILFQGAMARAILAGTKTQTRRVVKPQPVVPDGASIRLYDESASHMTSQRCWQVEHPGEYDGHNVIGCRENGKQQNIGRMPFCVGDRLWVRETFYAFGRWVTRFSAEKGRDEWHFVDMTLECGKTYAYAADGRPHDFKKGNQRSDITPAWWKRPAIFMPRAASRVLLEVNAVRVEKLQEISEADAMAEGIDTERVRLYAEKGSTKPAMRAYADLWGAINGDDGPASWAANPWVWVVEFKRIEGKA